MLLLVFFSILLYILFKFISIHGIASSHEHLNGVLDLIVCLKPFPDIYGLSLIGANYISDVQKHETRDSDGITHVTGSQEAIDLAYWEAVLEHSRGFHTSVPSCASSDPQSALTDIFLGQDNMTIGEHLAGESVIKEEFQNAVPRQPNWQVSTIPIFYLNCWYYLHVFTL